MNMERNPSQVARLTELKKWLDNHTWATVENDAWIYEDWTFDAVWIIKLSTFFKQKELDSPYSCILLVIDA